MKYSKKFGALVVVILIFMIIAMLFTCGSIFDPYRYPEMRNEIDFHNDNQYEGGIIYEI